MPEGGFNFEKNNQIF